MDPWICASLPAFHAFTGCNTVSSIGGKGKRKCLEYVGSLSRGHSSFWRNPSSAGWDQWFSLFTFGAICGASLWSYQWFNDSRKQLFTKRSRALESIPPTQEALRQHVRRASLQSVCWNQALELNFLNRSRVQCTWVKHSYTCICLCTPFFCIHSELVHSMTGMLQVGLSIMVATLFHFSSNPNEMDLEILDCQD